MSGPGGVERLLESGDGKRGDSEQQCGMLESVTVKSYSYVNNKSWGAWVAQWVKRSTRLGLRS